jgi:hypothetical protein
VRGTDGTVAEGFGFGFGLGTFDLALEDDCLPAGLLSRERDASGTSLRSEFDRVLRREEDGEDEGFPPGRFDVAKSGTSLSLFMAAASRFCPRDMVASLGVVLFLPIMQE